MITIKNKFNPSSINYLLIISFFCSSFLFNACQEDGPGPRPTITSFTPTSGPAGTVVTILGNNFNYKPANNIVTFNGTQATVTSASPSSLTVVVPAGATTGKITVTVHHNTAISKEDFSVSNGLGITGFSPALGATGSIVIISGAGFNPTPANNTVKFNGVTASVTAATSTTLTVMVPVGATTGKISVAVGSSTATSSADYQVVVEAVKAGGADFEQGNSVAVDPSGNTYVAGSFTGTANFGVFSLTSQGSDDIFLAKYNSSCDLVWVKQIGNSGSDIGRSVAVNNAGDIFMTGSFMGDVPFGAATLSSTNGSGDIFITKLNSSGNVTWAKQIGSGASNSETGMSVKVDGNGNLYLTGAFFESVTIGATNLTSAGFSDVFVAKYNSTSGDAIWAKRFGGTEDEEGLSLAVNAAGEIYLSGVFFGTTTFGATSLPSAGGLDAFLTKLNSAGDVLWANQIAGADWENAFSVDLDASGNCYVAGYFNGATSFGGITLGSAGSEDIFLAKYNSSGNVIWATNAGGNDSDQAHAVVVDGAGNAYITGHFSRTITIGGQSLTSNANSRDIFAAKYNTVGTLEWVKQAGGPNNDYGLGTTLDSNGTLYVTGSFNGSVTFGTTALTSSGSDDVYLWKIRQ